MSWKIYATGLAVSQGNPLSRSPTLLKGNLQGVLPQRQEADGLAAGGQFGQQGGVVIENLNINVDQVADVGDVDQLERRLAENLDLRQRNEGVVFPANR